MKYFETIDWDILKKDLQKNIEKGMEAVKKGAVIARLKAGEMTEEGRKQYKILTLKIKAQQKTSDLGARVYVLLTSKPVKNPALDPRVKEILASMRKIRAEIVKIEGKGKKTPAKPGKKKAARVTSKSM